MRNVSKDCKDRLFSVRFVRFVMTVIPLISYFFILILKGYSTALHSLQSLRIILIFAVMLLKWHI